jgi:hypothetical protein
MRPVSLAFAAVSRALTPLALAIGLALTPWLPLPGHGGLAQAQVPAAPAEAPPPGPEGPPAAAAAGAQFYRISVLEFSQFAYRNHPFLQITGDSDFKNGDAVSAVSSVQTPRTAQDENLLLKGIHSLPPFGVESVVGMDLFFPKAVSIGFDYTRFSQTDTQALDTTKAVVTIPRIQMDHYMYSVLAKAYAFPVNEPGMNFFAGLGLGILEGKFQAVPYAGARERTVSFSQTPTGLSTFGVEALGENWGLRYEIRVVRAREVKLEENPYLNQSSVTKVDFSGTLIKVALFYQF